MLPVFLRLDFDNRAPLEDLALIAAQIPSTALANPSLNDDAHAVFRVAKETLIDGAPGPVSITDIVQTLRFAIWVLSSCGSPSTNPELRPWIAEVIMQMQIQDSNFESVLKAYGVDRRLALEAVGAKDHAALHQNRPHQHTVTLKQLRVRVDRDGVDIASQTLSCTTTLHK